MHHTSDSHFNRRNGLFCQNFPHTFAVICQGLSCRLSGLQRDTASFSLPCLRQRRDPPCRSLAPPDGFCGSVVQRPNCARPVLSAEALGHLLPPLPHPADAMPLSGWFLGVACARGRVRLRLHPPALARGCGGSRGSRGHGARHSRPPHPGSPEGAGGTTLAEELGRKSMNAVQSKQILAEPAPS